MSTKEEVEAAVQAAKEAFPAWRATPPVTRARYLFRLKALLEENFEELSRIQTQEHGKCIDESRGETRRGIENVEVACGVPTLMMGYNLEDIASGIDEYVVRQPLGVFGIIGPFNFPFMIPLWSAPYAVATGNTVVVKPSPEVPLSQMRLGELVEEAGFPPESGTSLMAAAIPATRCWNTRILKASPLSVRPKLLNIFTPNAARPGRG